MWFIVACRAPYSGPHYHIEPGAAINGSRDHSADVYVFGDLIPARAARVRAAAAARFVISHAVGSKSCPGDRGALSGYANVSSRALSTMIRCCSAGVNETTLSRKAFG